jgi:hypothetical protein
LEKWWMKGAILGECNCDWGCPCNFDADPTHGECFGTYTWAVREGRYGDVALDGLNFAWANYLPDAMWKGHGTSALVVDEAASSEQRAALEELFGSGEAGVPFDILNVVTATWLDTVVTPIEVEVNGINSRATFAAGELYEVTLSRIKNPVTGDEEELYLDKPTGITALRTELGMSTVAVSRLEGRLAYENSGGYGEFSEFDYSGP